jgi:hypothetical protein
MVMKVQDAGDDKPVKVRVLVPFCIAGKRVEKGEIVTVSADTVQDLLWRGRAERV